MSLEHGTLNKRLGSNSKDFQYLAKSYRPRKLKEKDWLDPPDADKELG